MTAAGKINASKVTIGDRIIVTAPMVEGGVVSWSSTKTGEVLIVRVTGKRFREAQGRYEARGKYVIETTAGTFEAAGIQTMWLAPEDAAGVKRALTEATLINDEMNKMAATPAEIEVPAERNGEDLAEARQAMNVPDGWAVYVISMRTVRHYAVHGPKGIVCQCGATAFDIEKLAKSHQRSAKLYVGWGMVRNFRPDDVRPEELAEVEVEECPRCDGPLASDRVCADDECGADSDDLVASERPAQGQRALPRDLTLHSQAGKVDYMNNDAAQSAPALTTENHTGSAVVGLLEKVWTRIREDHPELPEVVIITGSGLVGGSKWGHFRAEGWKVREEGAALRKHELFLAGEALAKGARQVLQTMLHEGAHTLARVRNVKDTSRQGRWHNQVFRKTAEEMGLEHKASSADSANGFSLVTLTQATADRYADLLEELDREIRLVCHLPTWMGGTADEDEGGEKITGKAPKDGDEDKPKSGNLKATCTCETPVIIRLSQKVIDLGVVRCDLCCDLFTAA